MEHPKRRLKRKIILPVQLVTRASCAIGGSLPAPSGSELHRSGPPGGSPAPVR
jgi:hypothetical protein